MASSLLTETPLATERLTKNPASVKAAQGSDFTHARSDSMRSGSIELDEDLTTADLLALNDALSGTNSRTELTAEADAREARRSGSFGSGSFRLGKRIFDVVFSLIVLVVLAPVLLICAAAIRVESKGPALFRHRRLGKGGQSFFILKFRTMIPNAEAALQRVLENDPNARAEWEKDRKLRNDPRVTRLGRFMRRTSLDELPQFWNVLRGDMSVVGPRPIVTSEIPLYRQAYKAYCAVQPGITGLWQVSGRNDTGYDQRVALDREYVNSTSARLEMSIVLKTIKTVVAGAGAY